MGQGAPLVPAFHQHTLTHPNKNRVILNIGGIANVTLLSSSFSTSKKVTGFDTGPGNGLIDAWINKHKGIHYDKKGDWARSGKILKNILGQLLKDPYFSLPEPKSTGKEYFNLSWLTNIVGEDLLKQKPEDIQATLTELTAITVANSIFNCSVRLSGVMT